MGEFLLNSFLLGVGLAMDAFSVSVASGMDQAGEGRGKMFLIAGTFGGFQLMMPLLGWLCVHTIVERFQAFARYVPVIALVLLAYLGIRMILEAARGKEERGPIISGGKDLLLLGVATSIDALSTGFAIAEYGFSKALLCSVIIGVVTFAVCIAGVAFGKKIGEKLAGKAGIAGGIILIAIGLEIFIKSIIGG